MSDQAPVTPDTPTPISDTPEIPWQKRYEDLRPEYDRTTQQLREEQSVWEDEQALLARLAEKYPHLLVEEEEEASPEPEYHLEEPAGRDPRVDMLEQQAQQFAAWQAEQQYTADLKEVLGDRTLTDQGMRTVKTWTNEGGNNRKALEAAVNEWFEMLDGLKADGRDEHLATKRASATPPQPGRQGEPAFDPTDRKARRARFAQIAEAGGS